MTLIKNKVYLLSYQGHEHVSLVSTCFGTNIVVTIPAVTNALHNSIGLVFVLYNRDFTENFNRKISFETQGGHSFDPTVKQKVANGSKMFFNFKRKAPYKLNSVCRLAYYLDIRYSICELNLYVEIMQQYLIRKLNYFFRWSTHAAYRINNWVCRWNIWFRERILDLLIELVSDHTFMASTINGRFSGSAHSNHPQNWTIDLTLKNNRIRKHVTKYQDPPPLSY